MSLKDFLEIDISDLVLAEWNYKKDDEFLQTKLMQNLKKNGQIENLIVRQIGGVKYEVVNGNHRLLAMQAIGQVSVVCYNLGVITDAQAKKIAIITNETKFKKDDDKFKNLLDELSGDFGLEDLDFDLPFTGDEIKLFNSNNLIHEGFSFNQSKSRNDSEKQSVNVKYNLIVELENEIDLKNLFDYLNKNGYKVKVKN